MQTGQKGKGGMPMNQKGLAAKLVKLNHITHKIVLFIAQASILAMVAIVTLTVILRYCFNTGLSWAEEVPRLLVTVFAFIACAIGVRDHMHVAVNAIYNKFPVGGKVRKALDVLTDVGNLKVSIISSGKTDKKTILYDAPTAKAKEIMRLSNGTACFTLFGRKEGEWRRVRVGGVSGWIKYTQTGNLYALGDQMRSVVPYYPLLMQTKSDTLLYQQKDDAASRYMTLGQGMYVELLAESDNYAYVRTSEGGSGAYDCGDFGFLPIANLSLAQTSQSIGVAQADDGDLPVVVLGDPDDEKSVIGALCSGAQARITSYTQTDYVQISLGSLVGYVKKSQIRVLTAPNEPLSDRIPQRATTKTDVDIRFKPEVKAAVAETVSSGARVYMFGKFGDWAYVLAGDSPSLDVTATTGDRAGFVPLAALNAPASTTHLTASVLKDKVNVRSEADNQSGAIIGKARTGDRLLVTDYGNKWTGVVLPNGKRGYMMTEYLQFD